MDIGASSWSATSPPKSFDRHRLTALPMITTADYVTHGESYRLGSAPYESASDKEHIVSMNPEVEFSEPIYPTSWRLLAIVTALCLAVFCMALDNTIIATAIPRITDEFHALEDVAWYISAYLLTTCSFQLFFGRLYTFFSVKWVFLMAVGLFEAGSLLCGAAPTSQAFIVGRALAGMGSAGIFSGGILIIAHSVPLRKRPIYIAIAGSMYGIASVAGPLLGGVFTDHLSWRWCFYINLPIGTITILFLLAFFESPAMGQLSTLTRREKLVKLDLPGTIFFIPSVVCLILALQWGGLQYDWSDGHVVALLVMAILLQICFLIIQWKQQDNATVPPRILKQRSVAAAAWYAFMFGGSFFILIYYVPIWFQAIWGITATQSGIDSLPLVLSSAIFCVVSGAGITFLGYFTPWLIASSVIMTIGSGLVSTFWRQIPASKWIGYQVFAGAGFGLGIQIPVIIVQAVLPPKDIATGVAVIMFAQTLGGALFIAVAQNVFLAKLSAEVQQIIPNFSVKTIFESGGATSVYSLLSGDLLYQVLDVYSSAIDQTFYAATALAALSILGAGCVEWKSVKGQFLMGAA